MNVNTGQGANVVAGNIMVMARTNEMVLVTAVSTDQLTITRGYGSVAAAAGVDQDEWFIIGYASLEDDFKPTLISTDKTAASNFLQFFRKPYGASDIQINSLLYGGIDIDYQRRKAGIEFLRDIEKAALLGYAKEDTSGTSPRRTTGGLLSYISTNVTDFGGFLSESTFEDYLRPGFRYGSTKKLLVSAPQPLSTIAMFAQNRLRLIPRDKTFGVAIVEYVSPHGTVGIVKDNVLEGSTGFGGMMFLIDMENMIYRYLTNEDVHIVQNIQNPDESAKIDEYRAVCGFQIMLEKVHSLGKNINNT